MSEDRMEREVDKNPNQGLSNSQMETLFNHFSRMMRVELGPLHEKMSRLEVGVSGSKTESRVKGKRVEEDDNYEEDDMGESPNENWERNGGGRGTRGRRNAMRGRYCDGGREDNNMENVKVTIPSFQGKSDPEAYLELEKRREEEFRPLREKYRLGYKKEKCDRRVNEYRRGRRDDRRDRHELYEDPFTYPRKSIVEKKIKPKSMTGSSHGYQGISKYSNIYTYDIPCPWCLEMGHDIHHCPKEDEVVLKKKVDVEVPIVDIECIESCAVEGESLDDVVVSNELVEKEMNTCNALVEICSTSDACVEVCVEICEVEKFEDVVEPQVEVEVEEKIESIGVIEEIEKVEKIKCVDACVEQNEGKGEFINNGVHFVLENMHTFMDVCSTSNVSPTFDVPKECLVDQLHIQNMSEKEKENENKNEKDAKIKEKKNELIAQKSEDERYNLYEPLNVLLYKEVLSHCYEKAGFIPSKFILSLQEVGGVLTKRRDNITNENVRWIELFEFKGNQSEVVINKDLVEARNKCVLVEKWCQDITRSYRLNLQDQRLSDIVGSAYYVAPEVLHRSYSSEADIWSIGVITYILLCGSRPFWARTESGIFRSVLRADPNLYDAPWPTVSAEAKDFVKKLLNRDHRKRMTAAQALTHPWVRGLNCAVPLDMLVYRLTNSYIRATPLRRAALRALSKALTDEELFYLRVQFKLLEPMDGCVSLDNFRTALLTVATDAMRESRVADILNLMEPLSYKKMNFEEFCAASISPYQLEALERWEDIANEAFQYFEQEGNRVTSVEELVQEFNLGPTAYSLLKDWIRPSDGRLSFLGYTKFLHGVTVRNLNTRQRQ